MKYTKLPIYQHKQKIIDIISANQVVIVESPTGSGKTTQLPVILHEAGFSQKGIIGITQPRRIAAVGISAFIEKQLNDILATPPEVAFKIRFMDNTSPYTQIKIMTDGILLQELKADPYLSRYAVIMIDEAHERSLNIDFILGLLKHRIKENTQLKIIISSATIRAEVFSQYFNNAPVVRIDTEIFPVNTVYSPLSIPNDNEEIIEKITQLVGHVLSESRGDILIFLSGEKIIRDCVKALYSAHYRRKIAVIPLYGRLSKEEQDEVFPPAPKGKTKIVVATNIAETSITIDGIETVIDSGLAKINYHDYKNYTSRLQEKRISKASANQRKGRAGRTAPGRCYRLYTPKDYENSPEFSEEEIYRRDLSEVVLRMADIGIRDFEFFDFISSPGKAGIRAAVKMLRDLQALEVDLSLSDIGRLMTAFPLLPRHARILVEAMYNFPDIIAAVLVSVSFISTSSPFLLPPGEEENARTAHAFFLDKQGDFVSYIKIFTAYTQAASLHEKLKFCEKYYLDPDIMYEIVNIFEQLGDIVRENGLFIPEVRLPLNSQKYEEFVSSMALGLIHFICERSSRNSYLSLFGNKRIDIHPGSLLFAMKSDLPQFIVAGEIVQTTRSFARSASPIEREIIQKIAPQLYKKYLNNKKHEKSKTRKRKTMHERKSSDNLSKRKRLRSRASTQNTEEAKHSRNRRKKQKKNS